MGVPEDKWVGVESEVNEKFLSILSPVALLSNPDKSMDT